LAARGEDLELAREEFGGDWFGEVGGGEVEVRYVDAGGGRGWRFVFVLVVDGIVNGVLLSSSCVGWDE